MKLDKETRDAIVAAVKKAATDMHEMYDEEWVTGDQLGEVMPFFSKDWLRRYGAMIPRERLSVKDLRGEIHRTCWCYPKKRLLRMLNNGELRRMSVGGCGAHAPLTGANQ